MIRTWKMFGVQTLVAVVLAAAPGLARAEPENDNSDIKDIKQRLETIEKGLTAIQKSLDAASKAQTLDVKLLKGKINKLEEQMGALQTTVDALKKKLSRTETEANYPPEGMDEFIKSLINGLVRIEKKLDRLTTSTQVAKAPPEVGTVALNNRYDEEILFTVNGTSYRLAPGTSRSLVDVPAGSLTYEVISPSFGLVRRKTTTLAPNKTLSINVD
jgi:hypothetical protein